MQKMVFTVYENQDGRAVNIGDVSAPNHKEAEEFVISQGFEKGNFMLVKIEG